MLKRAMQWPALSINLLPCLGQPGGFGYGGAGGQIANDGYRSSDDGGGGGGGTIGESISDSPLNACI